MHLLSTRPGGFVEDENTVVCLNQTPADVVVLSSADTTLSLLAAAHARLEAAEPGQPSLRLVNLMFLRQPASMDLYVDEVLQHAKVVVVDHLGAESAWPYGIQQLGELAREKGQQLAMFSGDLQEDENLLRKSTAPAAWCRALWQYLRAGSTHNATQFLRSLSHHGLQRGPVPQPPRTLPQVALHLPPCLRTAHDATSPADVIATLGDLQAGWRPGAPVVALVFYRSHLQSGNTAAFDALAQALFERGLNPLPLALDSLKEPLCLATLRQLCNDTQAALVLNTTAFAALPDAAAEPLAGDAPVFQVIVSGTAREDWLADPQGLRPRDIAMQIALPEVDGRIVTRAVSFKGLAYRCELTQTDVLAYQPDLERTNFVAELAQRWCRLRTKPVAHKRVALVLANYPGSEGRIGSGVGLDTPASVIAILHRLAAEGYALADIPADGHTLMQALQQGIANDPTQWALRPAWQSLPMADYRAHLATLPAGMAAAIDARWGPPEADPLLRQGRFMVAGLRLGHVFVGIQPARANAGEGAEATDYASYHDADLVPPHNYLAFYLWLRQSFCIDAIVHVGKHGNLEWLPGKSLALSDTCWPDAILGPLPHLYPFIVNDPGEGAQAKRRTQAVIVDHLMPPLTRADSYGPLQDLERQVDEYYDALLVDARRATLLRGQILAAVKAQKLDEELGADDASDDDALLQKIDAYLCELKETQIRDGLHVFGSSPVGRQRDDTLLALARFAVGDGKGANAGLLQALSHDLLPDDAFAPFGSDVALPWTGARPALLQSLSDEPWRHHGDTRERLELLAAAYIADRAVYDGPHAKQVLQRVQTDIAPALDACGSEELRHLMRGLQGRFVPPGPSGSPSRGRPDVLPTGRNFYSVDTRAIPTPSAWSLGVKSANLMLERHLQDHGDYPRAVGLSVWGTATMRTGGDDLAQAFALLGVRPKWAAGSHRVIDVELLPVAVLGRPRIDVTLRISGFFRDAFPGAIQLFDAAVQAVVAQDDEDEEQNPLRARVLRERDALVAAGAGEEEARQQAGWRVFGSPPGHYGSGLQPLFDHGRWQTDEDLATAYVDWGAHAYGQQGDGLPAAGALKRRLRDIDVVAQNQDNREHDLLDSNDYYQFQGGMVAAVRSLSGQQPAMYHGDHSNPQVPRIRSLTEEIARVVRARVVNPKWIDGVKRHGYKGAFEMAATVDYLFGFDATTRVVGDHQYALVADAYVLDAGTRAFVEQHNPQALGDMLEKLLEAMQRGLWQEPGDYQERLENLLLDHEQRMEGVR